MGVSGSVPLAISGVVDSAQSIGVSPCIQFHCSNYVIAFISCGWEVIEHNGFYIGSNMLLHYKFISVVILHRIGDSELDIN